MNDGIILLYKTLAIITVPTAHAKTKTMRSTELEDVLQRSSPQHVTSQSLRFARHMSLWLLQCMMLTHDKL